LEFFLKGVEGEDPAIPPKLIIYNFASKEMKEYWNDSLGAIYGDLLEDADTKKGKVAPFTAGHFLWHYRFSLSVSIIVNFLVAKKADLTQGKNAPKDALAQELTLVMEVPRKSAITSLTTRIPRQGKEVKDHMSEYVKLQEGLETYFTFLDASVSASESKCPFSD
jgi:hypothetical protein